MENTTKSQLIKPIKRKKNSIKSDTPFLLMLSPAVVVVFLFSYLPMFALILAFKDYNMKLGILGSPFTSNYGFQNFIRIFSTPDFTKAIWNTLYINVLSLLISFPAPLIFALLLNEIGQKTFKKTVQTISYLPHFLSWIAVTGMVTSLMSPYGAFNNILVKLGLERYMFLEKKGAFLPTYIITNVWKSVGWGSIIYLASIAGVSPELYEAARIDGAGRFKQALNITLPALMPTAMILLIMNVGSIFNSNFELVFGLQKEPFWNTEVISTVIYKYGLNNQSGPNEFSLTTALGLIQGLVALTLTFGANWLSKKLSSVSMW